MKKGAKDLRGKRPKGQMTGGANDLGAKDRGGKSPTPEKYTELCSDKCQKFV